MLCPYECESHVSYLTAAWWMSLLLMFLIKLKDDALASRDTCVFPSARLLHACVWPTAPSCSSHARVDPYAFDFAAINARPAARGQKQRSVLSLRTDPHTAGLSKRTVDSSIWGDYDFVVIPGYSFYCYLWIEAHMRCLAACTLIKPIRTTSVTSACWQLTCIVLPTVIDGIDSKHGIHQEPTSIYNLLKEEKSDSLYLEDKRHSSG